MIISPPFLPTAGAVDAASSGYDVLDPMMDLVDKFELAHGIYPIAFDRRWHTGVHLMPDTQNERVRAIADGEVVAYRVCQKAIDGGEGALDSNAGFVLLKHSTETGEGRSITFYSLYMHLLDLDSYTALGIQVESLPEFLRTPTSCEGQAGASKRVYRKDVLGLAGACHGMHQVHFEIFMLPADFTAYFGGTQLDNKQPATPPSTDYWGHTYFIIPAGQSFLGSPTGTENGKLKGIAFDALQSGSNQNTLHVETYFQKGSRYTNTWSVAQDGTRTLLTPQPVKEDGYEYDMYKRATALYGRCPSDGYELLRFGRILSDNPTLQDGGASTPVGVAPGVSGNSHPMAQANPRTTWLRITYEQGKEGYLDVNDSGIVKLSDADFPFFTGWTKISEQNTPYKDDGMCDVEALQKIVNNALPPVVNGKDNEYQDEDALCNYILGNDSVRQMLKGFICEAPSEWDSAHNDTRYGKLNEPDGFYGKQKDTNPSGYSDFLTLLKKFQFWDKTGLPDGKLWFFHPLQFIRHFRRCGWLSADEFSMTFPRYLFYSESGNPRTAITTENHIYTITKAEARARVLGHVVSLNKCTRKYLGSDRLRISVFLAQVLLETAQWRNPGGTRRLMHEWGFGQYSSANPATQYYTAFYGRGIMQLTWAGNYKDYGDYKKLPDHSGAYIERLPSVAAHPRITSTSQHYTLNPNDNGQLMTWAPRFDPDIVAEDHDLACDSGGFYWVSKPFSQGININRVVDRGYSPENVGFVNRLVNGGFNGYYERHAYSLYILGELTDFIQLDILQMIAPPHPKNQVRADLHRPE
ncbi:peptidase M23 [Burkholderia sp. Ax-1719]|uniref:peptidase M23 n=1 Tax=Burkholderia sp. Ax-1719 TaxID=2608334 RepID=UPI00141EC862|nr:peptidase M23 [Burkholderia sp. Ax-1719]NIE66066.1 peptidase M23 [Burkholderia sp. Ax-1719]